MRIAVWPYLPARALGYALSEEGATGGAALVTDVRVVDPHEARGVLERGEVDLALIPTLSILRGADGLDLVPGAGVAAESWPYARLLVRSPLTEIGAVALDARDQQEAVLAQVTLTEHYGRTPTFRPTDPELPLADRIGGADALLVTGADAEQATLDGAIALDLTQEWLELTMRPMVHGLLAAPAGTISPEKADALRQTLQAADARLAETAAEAGGSGLMREWQITLGGYAMDGLEAFVQHLFYRSTLGDVPDLPFLPAPPADDSPDGSS